MKKLILLCVFTALNALLFQNSHAQERSKLTFKGDTVGMVNGKAILKEEFYLVFNQTCNEDYKDSAKLSNQEFLEMQQKTWDNVVMNRAINDIIERKGITISDSEIWHYLTVTPPEYLRHLFIDSMGVFDSLAYLHSLTDPRNDSVVSEIFKTIRPALKKEKLSVQLKALIPAVTDDELWQDYKKQKGATKKEFEEDKNELREEATNVRTQLFFQKWVDSAKAEAKVIDYRKIN